MATRFIPTVERESIDLMFVSLPMLLFSIEVYLKGPNRCQYVISLWIYCSLNINLVWNKELLYVGGFLARCAYELELKTLADLWNGATANDEIQRWLRKRSIHTLKFFTFYQSTPSGEVSALLEKAFFSCAKPNQFPVLSSVGVRDASTVRLPDPTLSKFLKQLAVIDDDVMSEARLMVTALQNRKLLRPITFSDVLDELRSRPLGEEEMIACLTWWISLNKDAASQQRHSDIHLELINAAVLTTGGTSVNERIIPLSVIETFVNVRSHGAYIPLDGPLPIHVLPMSIMKHFSPEKLINAFSWRELTILEWLTHLCSPSVMKEDPTFDLTMSAHWAEKVLTTLVRTWPSLSNTIKERIVILLGSKKCIPTSAGLQVPQDAYFSNANIFNDLPVVMLPSGAAVKSSLERVLETLGVRKHVDLQIIFKR